MSKVSFKMLEEIGQHLRGHMTDEHAKAVIKLASLIHKNQPSTRRESEQGEQLSNVLKDNLPTIKVGDYMVDIYCNLHPSNKALFAELLKIRRVLHSPINEAQKIEVECDGATTLTSVGASFGVRRTFIEHDERYHYRLVLPLNWIKCSTALIEDTYKLYTAALAEQQRQKDNEYLDTSIRWPRLRKEFGVPKEFTQQMLRDLLQKRFNLSNRKVSRDFGGICAYIVLRELENAGNLSTEGLCERLAEAINTDILSLVEK